MKLEYVDHPSFRGLSIKKVLAEKMPAGRPRQSTSGTGYFGHLQRTPLLTREQEIYLFRRMNFLYRAVSRRYNETYFREAQRARNLILESNLRIVVHLAKKRNNILSLDEWISEGNLILFRAVARFDYSRGFRFITFAYFSIRNAFNRAGKIELRYQSTFQTNGGDCSHPIEDDIGIEAVEEAHNLLTRLSTRPREIVKERFWEGKTLQAIGDERGVCKERIRQIVGKALEEMRT